MGRRMLCLALSVVLLCGTVLFAAWLEGPADTEPVGLGVVNPYPELPFDEAGCYSAVAPEMLAYQAELIVVVTVISGKTPVSYYRPLVQVDEVIKGDIEVGKQIYVAAFSRTGGGCVPPAKHGDRFVMFLWGGGDSILWYPVYPHEGYFDITEENRVFPAAVEGKYLRVYNNMRLQDFIRYIRPYTTMTWTECVVRSLGREAAVRRQMEAAGII